MFPYLHLGCRDIPLYGLLMLAGALCGWLLCQYRVRHAVSDLAASTVTHCFVLLGVCGLVGAKIYSLVLVWPHLVADLPLVLHEPLLFLQRYLYGGLVFYGGLMGVAGGVLWVVGRRKVRFFHLETVFLPAVPLIHAFGRVGCFCAGCCYGKATQSAWGVVYPTGGFAPAGIPLFPVQLWEAAGNLCLLCILLLPFYHNPGQRLAVYLLGYGLLRFTLECFRGDAARGMAGPLSGAQWISLVCIVCGVALALTSWIRHGTIRRKQLFFQK